MYDGVRKPSGLGVGAFVVSVIATAVHVGNGVWFTLSVADGGLYGSAGFVPYLVAAGGAALGGVMNVVTLPLAITAVAARAGRAWATLAIVLIPLGWVAGFCVGAVGMALVHP